MKSPHSQAHSGGCNFGKGAAGGADDGAACAGGLSDAEAAAARLNSAGRSPGNRGPSSLFSRRAHLLTTASAQTPYPSPRRKRQVSSIPLCLLFPQSQRLCGSPFAAVVLAVGKPCALRGGIAAVATASRQCHSACKCCCHRLRDWANTVASTDAISPTACANLPPAALPQRWTGLLPVHFLFCERETEKRNHSIPTRSAKRRRT